MITMVDVKCLSDHELHKHLKTLGFTPGPILRMPAVNIGGGVGVLHLLFTRYFQNLKQKSRRNICGKNH